MTSFDVLGFVLQKTDYGEVDAWIDMVTDRFGRIGCHVRGVSYLKSKLRYSLEPYSLVKATILQTKSGQWRLINAVLIKNLYYDLSNKDREVIVRLQNLLSRAVPPDELSSFEYETDLLQALQNNTSIILNNYLLVAIDILRRNGYIDEVQLASEFPNKALKSGDNLYEQITQSKLSDTAKLRLQKIIISSLQNSGL